MAIRLPWRSAPAAPAAGAPEAAGEAAALSHVVGALLQQLTTAQAQANQTAVQLGRLYVQDPWLTRFPVPALALRTVDVELRVAVVAAPVQARTDDVPEVQVLFTANQLAAVPTDHVSTIRLKVQFQPRRLVEVDGEVLLLP
jgi:hypothetical protein